MRRCRLETELQGDFSVNYYETRHIDNAATLNWHFSLVSSDPTECKVPRGDSVLLCRVIDTSGRFFSLNGKTLVQVRLRRDYRILV